MTLHFKKRIDSETLHIPELRHLIGKTVDITVQEESDAKANEFWNPPTLDELIARHDAQPQPTSSGYRFTDADFEGFDETLDQWRKDRSSDTEESGT